MALTIHTRTPLDPGTTKKRSENPEIAQHALGVRDRISNSSGRKGRAEIEKKLVVGSEVDGSVSNTTSQEKPDLDSGFKPPIFCEILYFPIWIEF